MLSYLGLIGFKRTKNYRLALSRSVVHCSAAMVPVESRQGTREGTNGRIESKRYIPSFV